MGDFRVQLRIFQGLVDHQDAHLGHHELFTTFEMPRNHPPREILCMFTLGFLPEVIGSVLEYN